MISIVIPLYNKEKSVRTTLESVRAQSYKDWECVVVDDGSTDKSLEVVEQFKIEDLRFKILSKTNGGVCSARNAGIMAAKGEYVALLDGDDIWDKDYLAEQVKMIHDFPEAAMWGINFAETKNGKLVRRLETALPDGYRGYVEKYFEMKGRISDLFHSSAVVIRKEVFDKVGYFDERIKYSEDVDMWWRIIAVYTIAFYDRYMVHYQQDTENRAMDKRRALRYSLPFFVDKYKEPIFKQNKAFYKWANRWCGGKIKMIYFHDLEQYEDAKAAARRLDYKQLPVKYRFELLTPYWFGKQVYKWLK